MHVRKHGTCTGPGNDVTYWPVYWPMYWLAYITEYVCLTRKQTNNVSKRVSWLNALGFVPQTLDKRRATDANKLCIVFDDPPSRSSFDILLL